MESNLAFFRHLILSRIMQFGFSIFRRSRIYFFTFSTKFLSCFELFEILKNNNICYFFILWALHDLIIFFLTIAATITYVFVIYYKNILHIHTSMHNQLTNAYVRNCVYFAMHDFRFYNSEISWFWNFNSFNTFLIYKIYEKKIGGDLFKKFVTKLILILKFKVKFIFYCINIILYNTYNTRHGKV